VSSLWVEFGEEKELAKREGREEKLEVLELDELGGAIVELGGRGDEGLSATGSHSFLAEVGRRSSSSRTKEADLRAQNSSSSSFLPPSPHLQPFAFSLPPAPILRPSRTFCLTLVHLSPSSPQVHPHPLWRPPRSLKPHLPLRLRQHPQRLSLRHHRRFLRCYHLGSSGRADPW